MSTRIRLRRVGRKGEALFRIVVAERREARDGRFVETLGHYKPRANPAVIQLDVEKARSWLAKGAQPSDTVRSLFKKAGVFSSSSAPAAPPAG